MTESESKFHIEEYKELRKEVLEKITKTETLIQYAVLISAAVFSWLATQESVVTSTIVAQSKPTILLHPLARIAWWIPFASTFVIGIVGIAQYIRIKEMGEYLMKLEGAMGNSRLGWEAFLAKKPYTVSSVFALAWLTLFIGTGYIAFSVH